MEKALTALFEFDPPNFAYKQTGIQLIERLISWHNVSFALLTMSWENVGSQQVYAERLDAGPQLTLICQDA